MNQPLFGKQAQYQICVKYYDSKGIWTGKADTLLSFSTATFAKCILTCGIPMGYTIGLHGSRKEEFRFKYHMMKCALEVDNSGHLVVSNNLEYLDLSEMTVVAYYIGMFMTKVISQEIFQYEHLVHLKLAKKYVELDLDGKKEPDFVAFKRASKEASIFEAKGRKSIKKSMIDKAVKQVNTVIGIRDFKLVDGFVCASHPITTGRKLMCSVYDPAPDGTVELNITHGELLYLYYLPIYELLCEENSGHSSCSILLGNGGADKTECHVGMPQSLFDFFSEYPDFSKYDRKKCDEELEKCLSGGGEGDLLEVSFTF